MQTINDPPIDVYPDDPNTGCAPLAMDVDYEHVTVPAPEWLRGKIAWHNNMSRQDGDIHSLVSDALNDLLCVFNSRSPRSAAVLVRQPGHPFSGVDLDRVIVPDERRSYVADLIDEEAGHYVALGGDLAKLAAVAIFRLADDAEWAGAQTLHEFHVAMAERERAAFEAMASGY